MRVKFWGVRGSIPTPITTDQLSERLFRVLTAAQGIDLADPTEVRAFMAALPPDVRSIVGGNTACVEVDTGEALIILDCGTGIRELGLSLMAREFGLRQGVAHIFLTHGHWDHLQGFPFFSPAYVPGNRLVLYAVNAHPLQFLEHQQHSPTFFPVPAAVMKAQKEFVQLREGQVVQIGKTTVTNLKLNHPGDSYAYRIDDGESVFVFASDGEYKQLDDASLRPYVEFFAGADALAFDCQYSLRDVFYTKEDWGHSSAIIGVDIAERAGVRRLVTFHHDPADNDRQIHEVAASARHYAAINQIPGDLEIIVGSEGLELFLGPSLGLELLEQREADVWSLALAGHLDAVSGETAGKRLHQLLGEAPGGRLIADLTLLASSDAAGVGALFTAARARPGTEVAFVAPAARVRRTLEYSGVAEIGTVFHNRFQARAALLGPVHLRLHENALAGRYRLSQTILADETGVTYSGTDLKDGQPVVVHLLNAETPADYRQRFAAEMGIWSSLGHAGLVPGREVINVGGQTAYVSERPDGASWREWLDRTDGSVSQAAGLRWAIEVVEALAVVHSHQLLHGSLRPEKLIMASDRSLVARVPVRRLQAANPSAYRAPEQLRSQPIDQRTDLYAVGLLLYEALTGSYPYATATEELSLAQQLYGRPLNPRALRPELSPAVEVCLQRLLAVEPGSRFQSAEEVLSSLQALLA